MPIKLLTINFLTLIRIIGTIILIPIYNNYGGFTVGLFALFCYATDSIDGILARKWHASTFFGAFFDGLADKLFTIVNFIVLYLITPYAIIPIIIEILIILVQLIKYSLKYNVKSNIIGKIKVWVLAFSVVYTFFLSAGIFKINNLNNIYLYSLMPAIVMEILTLLSYILEFLKPNTKTDKKILEDDDIQNKSNFWQNFQDIWLNPSYYDKHKDDPNIKKIIKLK